MLYPASMPVDEEAAAWLTGLRTTDRTLHARLEGEAAAREVSALQDRVVRLQAQVAGLQGAVRVRDELLADQRVAIKERDSRIDTLVSAAGDETWSSRMRHTARSAVAVPRRMVRSARALVR
ncbi:hypothetical protein ASE38_11130 [Cellulomonas sp. Root930]|nr:hypothetical protein ASE38_11130 [Cellulomonas sp. Root930]